MTLLILSKEHLHLIFLEFQQALLNMNILHILLLIQFLILLKVKMFYKDIPHYLILFFMYLIYDINKIFFL